MTLGERIKSIRKDSGLNQAEFSERIGIVVNSVSRMEQDKLNPSKQTIELICREFNVNREWLRTGEGEMKEPPLDETADLVAEMLEQGDKDPLYSHILHFVKTYQSLDDKSKKVVSGFLDQLLEE